MMSVVVPAAFVSLKQGYASVRINRIKGANCLPFKALKFLFTVATLERCGIFDPWTVVVIILSTTNSLNLYREQINPYHCHLQND